MNRGRRCGRFPRGLVVGVVLNGGIVIGAGIDPYPALDE